MEEREELYEVSSREIIPKVLLILIFFAGAVFFGKQVRSIEFDQPWKYWTALILGEFAYLYSFVFVVVGITMFVIGLKEPENDGLGVRGTMLILCLAAIFQVVFWGVVYANYEMFKLAAVLVAIVIMLAVWLKLTSKK